MKRLVFSTQNIIDEFIVFSYLHGYDLAIIDEIIPSIRAESLSLYKRDSQIGGKRSYYFQCEWEEDEEHMSTVWLLPIKDFLSSAVKEYIKKAHKEG